MTVLKDLYVKPCKGDWMAEIVCQNLQKSSNIQAVQGR